VGIVALAAVGAALADTAPTGHEGADVLWRCLAAITVTAAGCTCGPVARIAPALGAAAVAGALESWGVAAAACAVLVASAVLPHEGRWAARSGAALVGAAVIVLFHLPDFDEARLTTLLAVASAAIVLVSGWRGAGRRVRRTIRWLVGAAGVVVVAMSAPFVVAGAFARMDVNRGAGEAHAWRTRTAEGESEIARVHLERAGLAFDEAAEGLDGWWLSPARLIPGVAQHVAAAETGVASGQRLVRSAEAILEVADPEDLKLTDGALDLDLVADVRVPLGSGADVLTRVEHDLDRLQQDWLFPTIQQDVREVTRQVRDAQRDAAFASRVLDVVPELLGADGPKRYFVIFSTPAEARELGGILGNWGILTARDGRLDLERTGRAGELNILNDERDVRLRDPDTYPVRYVRAQVDEFWQNVTSSPDLPTVSRAVADLYQQATGEEIDGVLVVDPMALSALLELTGPVEVAGLGEPLAAEDAVELLLRGQYLEFPELGERVDFLADAAEATFDRLTQGTLPGPARIADVLGGAVEGRHLLFWALDPAAQPVLAEVGLDGALPSTEHQDVLAIAHANLEANKLDAYLREDVRYAVEVESTGRLRGELSVTLTNEAPADLPAYVAANDEGLPPGTSRVLLSVWTPHRSAGAAIDGDEVGLERRVELGGNRYLRTIEVAGGATVTFTLRLEGASAGQDHRLVVVRSPRAGTGAIEATVDGEGGRREGKGTNSIVIGG
jgi:hypothetical protein